MGELPKRIACCKISLCKAFLPGLILVTILLKIACLANPQWFYQGEGRYEWKGSLTEVYETEGFVPEKSYSDLSDSYCDLKDLGYSGSEAFKDLCNTFENLNSAGVMYLAMASVGIIVLILGFIGVIWTFNSKKPNFLMGVTSAFSLALEIPAFSALSSLSSISYGDCDQLANTTLSSPSVCADSGVYLALFCMILTILCSLSVFISYRVMYAHKRQSMIKSIQKEFKSDDNKELQFSAGAPSVGITHLQETHPPNAQPIYQQPVNPTYQPTMPPQSTYHPNAPPAAPSQPMDYPGPNYQAYPQPMGYPPAAPSQPPSYPPAAPSQPMGYPDPNYQAYPQPTGYADPNYQAYPGYQPYPPNY